MADFSALFARRIPSEKKAALEKLESAAEDGQLKVKNFEQIKGLHLSFKEQSRQCTPEELITLVQTLAERVHVIRNGKICAPYGRTYRAGTAHKKP